VLPAAAESATRDEHGRCHSGSDHEIEAAAQCTLGDFDAVAAICLAQSGCADGAGAPEPCKTGHFFNLETNTCQACDRGGFFENRTGRVGWASHCACSQCKRGTFADAEGAVDPVAQCQVCPSGTRSDLAAGYRACQCLADFSRTDRFGSCESCKGINGIECSADSRSVQPGYYWRFSNSHLQDEYTAFACELQKAEAYNRSLSRFSGGSFPPACKCPLPKNCEGGYDARCLEGTSGPVCAVCDVEAGYFELNGQCFECPPVTGSIVLMLVLLAVFITALVVLIRYNAKSVPSPIQDGLETSETGKGEIEGDTANSLNNMTVLKIIINYTQVQALIPEMYTGVEWPSIYREMTIALQALTAPLGIMAPSCIDPGWTITAVVDFQIMAITPIITAVACGLYYLARAPSAEDVDRDQLKAVCVSTFGFVYYLFYPSITVAAARILAPCATICSEAETDCTEYMRADYSIDCGTSEFGLYRAFAGVAFALYSIAGPLAIAVPAARKLYARQCNEPSGRGADVTPGLNEGDGFLLRGIYSFYEPFRPAVAYWETEDMLRKLLVTGIAVFIYSGTSLQIVCGLAFSIAGWILHIYCGPYASVLENGIASVALGGVSLTLLLGLLLRAAQTESMAGLETADVSTIQTGIVLVTTGVLLYLVVVVVLGWRRYKAVRPRHHAQTSSKASVSSPSQNSITMQNPTYDPSSEDHFGWGVTEQSLAGDGYLTVHADEGQEWL